ncbi:hypothetical protein HZH68_002453 [Vespula germanica]|uniref:Uncharacterized protein n=1 Tax=Vespula germanica TaxID=30212 RepID=A0A834NMB4_VESGE|nr:hypothetical protein HZH68_002453 [Vespula germanica]
MKQSILSRHRHLSIDEDDVDESEEDDDNDDYDDDDDEFLMQRPLNSPNILRRLSLTAFVHPDNFSRSLCPDDYADDVGRKVTKAKVDRAWEGGKRGDVASSKDGKKGAIRDEYGSGCGGVEANDAGR